MTVYNKILLFCFLSLFIKASINAQTEDEEYVELDFSEGPHSTERNNPGLLLDHYDFIPCRKENTAPESLYGYYDYVKYHVNPTKKHIKFLNRSDKNYLCQLACETREEKYFNLLVKLIETDTAKKDRKIRIKMLLNLAAFNTAACRNVLRKIVAGSDKEMATISAAILTNFGDHYTGFVYLNQKYHNEFYPVEVYSALMQIKTANAAELLKRLVREQSDAALALDGLAALSLMGYCNDAFNGFLKYVKNENGAVRIMAASCLAYYIGTPEALDAIRKMQDDKFWMVRDEVQKILKDYNKAKLNK